jgi:tetratricopeptide (TPR) repeat protein
MAVALACALISAAVAATPPSKEALLTQLEAGSLEERRQAAALLGEAGDADAVPSLLEALKEDDEILRTLAEQSLWAIWSRSGHPAIDARLQEGIHLVQSRRLDEAIVLFDEIVKDAPDFAEAYNWRARARYLMGQYERAIADCEEAIKRNPVHFGALSGQGFSYLELGKPEQALRLFERSLAINPNKPKIRAIVTELKALLQQRRRQSI